MTAATPDTPTGDLLLRMSGIDKSFPGVHALRDVSLDLYAGEVLALVGENGAGKTESLGVTETDGVRRRP